MNAALNVLKHEIEQQEVKLEALRKEHKGDIERGIRAKRIVDNQSCHVDELRRALKVLTDAVRSQGVAA